jgi:hypothetical protein
LLMLQVGFSCLAISSGNLSAEWAVLSSSINVAAIPEEVMARATSPWDLISARIKLIKMFSLSPQKHQGKLYHLVVFLPDPW